MTKSLLLFNKNPLRFEIKQVAHWLLCSIGILGGGHGRNVSEIFGSNVQGALFW